MDELIFKGEARVSKKLYIILKNPEIRELIGCFANIYPYFCYEEIWAFSDNP